LVHEVDDFWSTLNPKDLKKEKAVRRGTWGHKKFCVFVFTSKSFLPGYPLGAEAFNFASQTGAFEITKADSTSRGNVLTQIIQQMPLNWCGPTLFDLLQKPVTVIGNYNWYVALFRIFHGTTMDAVTLISEVPGSIPGQSHSLCDRGKTIVR
jgi:hypothetical protein